MHRVDSKASSMAATNCRSGFDGLSSVVFHRTGSSVPSGKATSKPSCWPRAPNWVVSAWRDAPSASPWKSSTRGRGTGAVVGGVVASAVGLGVPGAGVVTRYQRGVPSTNTPCSWSVTDAPAGDSQPEDGTGVRVTDTIVPVAARAPRSVRGAASLDDVQPAQTVAVTNRSPSAAAMPRFVISSNTLKANHSSDDPVGCSPSP